MVELSRADGGGVWGRMSKRGVGVCGGDGAAAGGSVGRVGWAGLGWAGQDKPTTAAGATDLGHQTIGHADTRIDRLDCLSE